MVAWAFLIVGTPDLNRLASPHMALIVHIRPDGSLALDRRSTLPDTHPIPSSTLEAWGVTPGKPVVIHSGDEDEPTTFTFAGFGTKVSKGEEVADHSVLIYERQADDG